MFALHRMTWVCLLVACIGSGWFAYQVLLMPQERAFSPEWGDAKWVHAAERQSSVAYFRYVTSLNALPDAAFVTVAASQVFSLYVNKTLIASSTRDFIQGEYPRAYIYDITAVLRLGTNVIALRVAHLDGQIPCARVNLGMVRGNSLTSYGTADPQGNWLATTESRFLFPRYGIRLAWAAPDFDATSWLPARTGIDPPVTPVLAVNPRLYTRPVASSWMSVGAAQEAFFVRSLSLPADGAATWLRIATTGTASIFINGQLFATWDGQAPVPRQNIVDYLSDEEEEVHYRRGLAQGIYDITPYLRPGKNTIAVHVLAPGASAAQVGLESLRAALACDIVISTVQTPELWLTNAGWYASSSFVAGWENGAEINSWTAPFSVGRPGASQTFYLPDATTRNIPALPLPLIASVILLSAGCIIILWLGVSLLVVRCYFHTPTASLEAMSIVYLPALICEAFLIILSREPQIPRPFPYTMFWSWILILLVGCSYLLLIVQSRQRWKRQQFPLSQKKYHAGGWRVPPWLSLYGMPLFLVLVAVPLISYDLAYEPYWQDELSSYYASEGVLKSGLPFFPSGFLYLKAEAYSYLLAIWTLIFGNHEGVPRLISALEYIASIPLLYAIGNYFFGRRVALLAAAMLLLSPMALIWGRQVRMYEQAQLLTLLVAYLFCKAVLERRRTRFVYIAVLCLILNYLSHEETFIILPALLFCVFLASWQRPYWLPDVLYQKHWWYAAFVGGSIILLQISLNHFTHPPVLGTDSSQRPVVQLTVDNIPYYLSVFFPPLSEGGRPWFTLNSLLVVTGCFLALRGNSPRAKYCTLFLLLSLFTLILLFTMQADRYIYLLLPFYYLISAYALVRMMQSIWILTSTQLLLPHHPKTWSVRSSDYLSQAILWIARGIVGMLCLCVLLAPMLPISNYNLFVSRVFGFSYHRHYPDYDAAGRYLKQHRLPDDVVIAIAPDFSVYYYAGRVDYFFSIDRALFLLERDGHIINTSLGTTALLNQSDFQAVLSAHKRVWIVSDNASYHAQAMKRFVFPPDMRLVFEGYGSAIYLRGG